MKKLVSIILLVCLAAACMPALAATFTFDISSGTLTLDSVETQEKEFMQSLYKAREEGAVIMGDERGNVIDGLFFVFTDYPASTAYQYDLDKDGKWDLWCVQTIYTEYRYVIECTRLETTAIKGSYTVKVADPGIPFSELIFVFPGGASEPEPGPETVTSYTDATGVYLIGSNGEASYEGMLNTNMTSAKIPASITVNGKTYPVTKIADNAFRKNTKLKKATIGSNIKEIGKNAFNGCTKLVKVSGGANLEIIGDSAFAGCKALKAFTIGAKVKSIGKKAFNKCAALKKITIKTNLLTAGTVGSSAFKGIYKTATIKVPKAVKKDYSKWLLKKGVKKTMKIK